MESHGLHGDGIYYQAGNRLWVNLYVPSMALWKPEGVHLTMDTDFPEGESASLKLTLPKTKQLTVSFRRPSWAGDGFSIKINGKDLKLVSKPGTYVDVKRTWKSGDTVSLILPKALRAEPTPDNPNRVALLWGPLVLAGDLGPELQRRATWTEEIPSFVTVDRPMVDSLQTIADKPGAFRATGRLLAGDDREVTLVPFYRLHRREYAIYWDLYTADQWLKKTAEFTAEQKKQAQLEAATVAFLQPGDAQKEKEFNQQGEETTIDRFLGRTARRGKKWFSFDLPIDATHPVVLILTYHSEERAKRAFEIFVDGRRVGEQTIERSPPGSAAGKFFDVEIKLPADLIKDKKKVTIRFQSVGTNEIAAVYGIRMIREDAER